VISFTVTALVFGVVFLAELPDKTALAGLVLGTRYRASYVFAGGRRRLRRCTSCPRRRGRQCADACSRTAGRARAVVGVLFLGGAAVLLRTKDESDGDAEIREPENQSASGRSPARDSCSSWSPSSAISPRS
jgi:putative Ca2+/H+ antiporter (TMEM165/GDT1 family)